MHNWVPICVFFPGFGSTPALPGGMIRGMPSSSTMPPFVDSVAAACRDVFAGTRVFLAYAYGSRIRGDAAPGSDLDIGYYLVGHAVAGPLPLADEMVLADRLSRRTGVDVDLRHLGGAPLEWRGRVLEGGLRVFCSDEVARVTLERELLIRWLDEKPRIERLHDMRLRSFAASGI